MNNKINKISIGDKKGIMIIDESLFSSKNEFEFKILTYLYFLDSQGKSNIDKNDIIKKLAGNTKINKENFSKNLLNMSNLEIYKKVINIDSDINIENDKYVKKDTTSLTGVRNELYELLEYASKEFNFKFGKEYKNSIALNTRITKLFLEKNNIKLEDFKILLDKYSLFYDNSYYKSISPALAWMKEYLADETFYNNGVKIVINFLQITLNKKSIPKTQIGLTFTKYKKSIGQIINLIGDIENITKVMKKFHLDYSKKNLTWTLDTFSKNIHNYGGEYIKNEQLKISNSNKKEDVSKVIYPKDFEEYLLKQKITDLEIIEEYYHIYKNSGIQGLDNI